MEEIAQFREELTEIISRYRSKIPACQFISTVSSVLCKQLGIKRASIKWSSGEQHLQQILNSGPSFLERHALGVRCSAQMIAEASCDGDIKKCNRACYKGEHKCTD